MAVDAAGRAASRSRLFGWSPAPRPPAVYLALVAAILAVTALSLALSGRPLLCACGRLRLWDGAQADNSQHLADPYSALHVVFGFLVAGLLWRTSRHWPRGWLFVAAAAASALWEIIENLPPVIARFGDAAYHGDSIVNSAADTAFMLAGFALALRIPAWLTATLGVAVEALSALTLHDGLLIGGFRLAFAPHP